MQARCATATATHGIETSGVPMPPSCVSRARPPGIPRRPPPHRSSPPGMATVPCSVRTATASFRESRSERQRAAAPSAHSFFPRNADGHGGGFSAGRTNGSSDAGVCTQLN
ncbi:hypothetical protein PVAP13_1KG176100 [Panicum virgatum]|uniref:Uncharacterized protein n=1 Tax=Panicum virgatum TaxID=38727 RepID=A0A8T0XBH8_PANVG|nr:hypothetical protein PVAP13_1KG176100 [Panicum virgatum]